MKNIVILNSMPNKSTGMIALNLYKKLETFNFNPIFCYAHGLEEDAQKFSQRYKFSNKREYQFHKFMALVSGLQGYYSHYATYKLIRLFQKKRIDTLYILNIHDWFINEKMLFDATSRLGIKVVYIMVDEYPFLGRCCFSLECEEFKKGCGNCQSLNKYPQTWFFDRSRKIYEMKTQAYKKVEKICFVSPEPQIMLAKESPMMEGQKLIILDEAVDISVYKPYNTSALRIELGIPEDKIVIMGAAPFSDVRKGCQYILDVANELVKDKRFIFVHVGFDCPEILLPSNFIPVKYVKDQITYAHYLSMADLLVFPSFADTLSNTCIAALACGTPLLCFNISGMPFLGNKDVLTLVEPRDLSALIEVIRKTPKKDDVVLNTCRKYAEGRYDSEKYSERLIEIANNL